MNAVCKVSLCSRRTNSRYKNLGKPWQWLKDRNRNPVPDACKTLTGPVRNKQKANKEEKPNE